MMLLRGVRDAPRAESPWRVGALLLSGLLLLPLATVIFLAFHSSENIWPHLVTTVLPGYVWRTVLLMAGVGALTFLTGAGTAWLVTMTSFPGRGLLQWLLLVPLAMPTYIIAFTYVELLTYAGPLQSALRELFGWRTPADYWFPEIRSLGGAIFVMAMVLYPYVYLTARASFLRQSATHLEVARTLGSGPWKAFFSVALPLARPAIAVGVSLAMMETLNDIGAVEYFGVRTMTLGVYTTWLGRGNLGGAAQIAVVMLAFVFVLLWLERLGRRGQAFHGRRERPATPAPLFGPLAWAATLACALPIAIGFIVPASILVYYAVTRFAEAATPAYASAALNSLLVSAVAAGLAVLAGLFLAYANRLARGGISGLSTRLASLGYAVPGTVLGIGILTPLAGLDNWLSSLAQSWFGRPTGLLLTGGIAAIVFGYVVRFLAISYGALEAGLERVTPNLTAAARTLGRGPFATLIEVDLPLLRPALLSAALLVFVDCMKELPATLILRPFNFETLATHVYTLASLAELEDSALSALTIVVVGVIPVFLLSRAMDRTVSRNP